MSKKQDNSLLVFAGILLGGGTIIYLLNRINELSQKIEDNFNSQSQYIQHLLNKIAFLENETTNLTIRYQDVLEELEIVKQQIPDAETRQFLSSLIQKVKERKYQRTNNLGFYN